MFEEQQNLEKLVQKIMLDAQELLQCERCSVYLLDNTSGEGVGSTCGVLGLKTKFTEHGNLVIVEVGHIYGTFSCERFGHKNISVSIFSSPEPLGSQGELIGWP